MCSESLHTDDVRRSPRLKEKYMPRTFRSKNSQIGAILAFPCLEYSHLCSRDDAGQADDAEGGNNTVINRFSSLFYAFELFFAVVILAK